jgi:acetyl esterase/lipase
MLSVVVIEAGHMLALLPIALLAIPGWRRHWVGVASAIVAAAALLLFAVPVLRAIPLARSLNAELDHSLGSGMPGEYDALRTRAAPLDLTQLFTGVPIGRADVSTLKYAGAGSPLLLDFYRAQGARAGAHAPLVVLVHGGSWSGGSRTWPAPLAKYLASRGYSVASVDYRLAPGHPFPAAADDVRAAIAYLKSRGDSLGVDTGRVALAGRSAGGQLAVLVATRAHDPDIRGAVSLYGALDLRWGYANPGNPRVLDGQSVLRAYLGGPPGAAPGMYDLASPVAAVDSLTPPVLLIHGERDVLVSPRQSERFAARMEWAGRPAVLVELPWATHGCDAILRGPCGQITLYSVERFLGSVFR